MKRFSHCSTFTANETRFTFSKFWKVKRFSKQPHLCLTHLFEVFHPINLGNKLNSKGDGMKRIQDIIEEAATNIRGLRAAFVGDRDRGLVIATVNVGEINIHAVAAYATELVRANSRFSKAIGSVSGIESSWSLTASERFYIRMIPETDCYIAFVVSRSAPFYSFLPGLEKILEESRSVLPKATPQQVQST